MRRSQRLDWDYSNKYSDDLYQYLRDEGYTDEDLIRQAGLINTDERHGCVRQVLESCDVSNHGCQ